MGLLDRHTSAIAIDACMGATREQPDNGDVSAEAAGK
jgi:hypothetical protein